MNATALYRALIDAGAKENLAKEAAESVVYSPEGATKSDVMQAKSELQVEIANLRTELKGDIAELRTEFKSDIAALRSELKGEGSELKGDIAGLEVRIERSLRVMTWRFVDLLLASQALLFAGLRLTGSA